MKGKAKAGRSIWRQPLLHFLLAGAAIFALDAWRDDGEPADRGRIVVTVAQVERMAGLWQKTWGRPPTEAELQALVRDHIKEEIYYREALKLGLDVNDTVIRRRLRQKMEFLTTDTLETAAADDATLQAYFEQNAGRYLGSPVFDFEQVYLPTANEDRLQQVREELERGADPAGLGDPIDLPVSMVDADESGIARIFGSAFYNAIDTLETGVWSGPVESGFGRHMVRINEKTPAYIPSLSDVRQAVENDWRTEQGAALEERAFEELRAGYEVEIEVLDE